MNSVIKSVVKLPLQGNNVIKLWGSQIFEHIKTKCDFNNLVSLLIKAIYLSMVYNNY